MIYLTDLNDGIQDGIFFTTEYTEHTEQDFNHSFTAFTGEHRVSRDLRPKAERGWPAAGRPAMTKGMATSGNKRRCFQQQVCTAGLD